MWENDQRSSNPPNPSLTSQHPIGLPQQQGLESESEYLYEISSNPPPKNNPARYGESS
jgi:hypothetical protein